MGIMSTTDGIQTIVTKIEYNDSTIDTTETKTAVVNPTGYSKVETQVSIAATATDATITTSDYTTNDYVVDSSTNLFYDCILTSTTGLLLTDTTYFTEIDVRLNGSITTTTTTTEPALVVDTVEIDRVFEAFMATEKETLDIYFEASEISSELYSKVLAAAIGTTMQLAVQTAQQQPILDGQVAKTTADTKFVGKQALELGNSVIYNNQIKALDAYSDAIGTMGAGSLVISEDMWTKYFDMVQDLNDAGSVPVSTTITKL
jgi:hypothetical protein